MHIPDRFRKDAEQVQEGFRIGSAGGQSRFRRGAYRKQQGHRWRKGEEQIRRCAANSCRVREERLWPISAWSAHTYQPHPQPSRIHSHIPRTAVKMPVDVAGVCKSPINMCEKLIPIPAVHAGCPRAWCIPLPTGQGCHG